MIHGYNSHKLGVNLVQEKQKINMNLLSVIMSIIQKYTHT